MTLRNKRTLFDYTTTVSGIEVTGTAESVESDVYKVVGEMTLDNKKVTFQVYPVDGSKGYGVQGIDLDRIMDVMNIIYDVVDEVKNELLND
jgi:hypothetical protein